MDTVAILALFLGSLVLAVLGFRLHGRLAGKVGRPGVRSMVAFVVGWLAALTAGVTGLFLLSLLLAR